MAELNLLGDQIDSFDPDQNAESQFGLPLLWDMLSSTNVLSRQAFDCIKDIFMSQDSNDFKSIYIFKCLRNLKQG